MAYLGAQPGLTQRTLNRFIATAGQTVFSGVDSVNLPLAYTVGFLDVFVNGKLLPSTDYIATDGATLTINGSFNGGEDVILVGNVPFSPANVYSLVQSDARYPIATAAQPAAFTTAQIAQLQANAGTLGFLAGQNLLADGCCRFVYSSSTTCVLQPFNGNILFIGGLPYQIPSAGVTLSSAALAANILYYVYAYMAGSVMTLAASTTGYTVDAAGRKNMTGNAVYRLVGMVYCQSAATFTVSNSFVGVLSYFNRRALVLTSATGSNFSTASTSSILVTSTSVAFLTWADECLTASLNGYTQNSGSANSCYSVYGIDGATVGNLQWMQAFAANALGPVGIGYSALLSEGAHTAAAFVSVTSGTGNWSLTNIVAVRG